ncbi:hypothetical protein lerEdw1_011138 [Lerista edwardsae]|nr:hypothetical protein lerEdw1_011138 [Lerista edwardsae]
MVKLTAELIEMAAQYTNAVRDRELDLRGYKIPVIENLGATLDQFDAIDFSDNEIRKLDGFPLLKRLKTLLMNNNRLSRIGEGLEQSLPNLTELILTNNNIMELYFEKPCDKQEALQVVCDLQGSPSQSAGFPESEIKKAREAGDGPLNSNSPPFYFRSFNPGAGLPTDKKKAGPSPGDVEAIKNAIANATTLAEVERLKGLLQAGQIPGRDRKAGPSDETEEEMEEDSIANGS